MKLYFEKWKTETIWTGKLCSIDTDLLRERFDDLKDLSDEEIINELKENDCMYDLDYIIDDADALEASNSSEDKSVDYQINIHTHETVVDNLEWESWRRGCREFPPLEKLEYDKDKFINMIPEVKSFDMI